MYSEICLDGEILQKFGILVYYNNNLLNKDIIPLAVQIYNEFESNDHKIMVCALPIYPYYNRLMQNPANIETISILTGTSHAQWLDFQTGITFCHVIVSWMPSTHPI